MVARHARSASIRKWFHWRQCPLVRICLHLRHLREEYPCHHLTLRFLRFHMRLVHLLRTLRAQESFSQMVPLVGFAHSAPKGVDAPQLCAYGSICEESPILRVSWAATADLAKMVPFATLSLAPGYRRAPVPRLSASSLGCAKGSIVSWHARARSRRYGTAHMVAYALKEPLAHPGSTS
ncbi:hypothetical protein AHiyo1_44740 [Arthrobacter sp. Hiyo1]|nr:hypothetical protein AHiyo1_44740 [Arthrobacter sp. Hiyo1]